ncbi:MULTISPECIES: hypothetical protein [unclassified Polaribacter]|uniref:hypothetical protein n=1 Tax=unclassified Polaribacter TaxID=196858 RepID=UPI0029390ADB|nr:MULTISPECIES: hypothetical protein [unclassified Polaribacter]
MLQTTDSLNNGNKNKYIFGLFMDNVKGSDKIQHGVASVGFRSYASVYPEKQLSIAILTNFSSAAIGSIERSTAAIFLKPKPRAIAKK